MLQPVNNFQYTYQQYILQKRAKVKRLLFFLIISGVFILSVILAFVFFGIILDHLMVPLSNDGDLISTIADLIEKLFTIFFVIIVFLLLLSSIPSIIIFAGAVFFVTEATAKIKTVSGLIAPSPHDFMTDLHFLIYMEKNRSFLDKDDVRKGIVKLLGEQIKSEVEAHVAVLEYRKLYKEELIGEIESLSKRLKLKQYYLSIFIKFGVCHPDLFYYIEK
jgi:hypothetical protein